MRDAYPRAVKGAGHIKTEKQPVLALLHVHGGVNRGVLNIADVADGIPVLLKYPRLVWRKPREIRLVVGVYSGHQFYIRTVFVRKVLAPHVAEIAHSPVPHLFARGNMMIRDCDDSLLSATVVTGDKVHV
ncbi:hypothetical protein OH491_03435 [Termitidicoccus mucosus]